MTNSDIILKTYRNITSQLEKPYYILEGLPANDGNNRILYSSPNIKEVIGLSQFELASNTQSFFDSIHPDFVCDYLESNKKLLKGSQREKRTYLIRNRELGNFVAIEELATSRLNKERNCYEIYCSIRSIDSQITVSDDSDSISLQSAFAKTSHITSDNKEKIYESTHHFVDTMAKYFKMNACRFYGFNSSTKKLFIFADNQNKTSQKLMESTTRLKTKAIVPAYQNDSYFFELLMDGNYRIIENKDSIVRILKDHTENSIIKKFAPAAYRIYNLKSFGILPICCPNNKIVGLVTFGSAQRYNEDEKKMIYDFTTTNSFAFSCLLGELCNEF